MTASRRRLVLAATTAGLLGCVLAPSATAADVGITATLTDPGTGTRALTSILPVAMTNLTDPAVATGSLVVAVAEVTRSGNDWSVTASNTDGLSFNGTTIPNTALSITNRTASKSLGGGSLSAPTAPTAPLTAPVTLMSVTGQSSAALYTGTYTSNSTVRLDVPSGTPLGAYTGTLTVTLVQ